MYLTQRSGRYLMHILCCIHHRIVPAYLWKGDARSMSATARNCQPMYDNLRLLVDGSVYTMSIYLHTWSHVIISL